MGMAKTGLRATALVGVGASAARGVRWWRRRRQQYVRRMRQAGGTLRILSIGSKILSLDPQRNYTGEDLAFASGFLTRTLTQYTYVDGPEGWEIQGDLATDTGTPNEDATSWEFTLRDGVTWQDGSPVTCEDVKYGVSRTFAQTVITGGPTYAISMLDIPQDADGNSEYLGPYETKNNNTEAFDEAVTCDGSTITFNLNKPVPDFAAWSPFSRSLRSRRPRTRVRSTRTTFVRTAPTRSISYEREQRVGPRA